MPLTKTCSVALAICTMMIAPSGSNADEFDVEASAVAIFSAFSSVQQQQEAINVQPDRVHEVQDYLIALMRPHWGMDVGYLSDAVAEDAELPTGILLENMFTGTRAIITRDFGIDMYAAGEMVFRVKSENINNAQSREDVMAALHSVIPAVRMTDRLLVDESQHDTHLHTAANLQIRLYVFGQEIELNSETDWVETLSEVDIVLLDQNKIELTTSDTDHAHAHPVDAVLRLCRKLNSRGIQLKSGDVLGIGTWTGSHPVANITRLAAVFDGLDPNQPVQVYMGFR